jgi:hypothetical protein
MPPHPSLALSSLALLFLFQREELARTGAMFSGAPRLPTSSVIQAAAASAIRPVHGLVRGATKSDSVAAAAATGGRLSDWELYKLAQVGVC